MSDGRGLLSTVKEWLLPGAKPELIHTVNLFATAIFVKDRRHRFVMVNDAFCRLRGHAREAMIGKTAHEFLPRENADKARENEEKVFASGEDVYDEDLLTDGTGELRTYSRTKSLFTDRSGEPFLICVITEITAYKRALQECGFVVDLLKAQNEASTAGILIVDESSKVLTANRRLGEMWGLAREVLASGSGVEVLRAIGAKLGDPAGFEKRAAELHQRRDARSTEALALRDGGLRECSTAPVVGEDGRFYGRLWNFRDIDEKAA